MRIKNYFENTSQVSFTLDISGLKRPKWSEKKDQDKHFPNNCNLLKNQLNLQWLINFYCD